jgi:hypothetical protein
LHVGDMLRHDVIRLERFMVPIVDNVQLMLFAKKQIREWFTFRSEFAFKSPYEKVGHLRRFLLWDQMTNVSEKSYSDAMCKFGYNPDDFEVVHAIMPHKTPDIPEWLEYIVDFQILIQAKVMFRANSSFSYIAAELGCGEVYSPNIKCVPTGSKTQWCNFEKGNHGSFWPRGSITQTELLGESQ